MAFRCAAASLDRQEPLVGTASTVRAFLLVDEDRLTVRLGTDNRIGSLSCG